MGGAGAEATETINLPAMFWHGSLSILPAGNGDGPDTAATECRIVAVRAGLRAIMQSHLDCLVATEANTWSVALALLNERVFDLVIIEYATRGSAESDAIAVSPITCLMVKVAGMRKVGVRDHVEPIRIATYHRRIDSQRRSVLDFGRGVSVCGSPRCALRTSLLKGPQSRERPLSL